MALSKKNAALLATIVASMANEATPYHMVTEAEAAALVKEGLVETNGEIRDGDKIAARATEKGTALNTSEQTTSDNSGATASTPSEFVMGTGFVPSAPRGGRGRSRYDFDGLEVGGFIFVPTNEANPNPAKRLASTVSSANKRNKPKVFGVQSVKSGVVYGEFTAPADGAVIYRAADAAATA